MLPRGRPCIGERAMTVRERVAKHRLPVGHPPDEYDAQPDAQPDDQPHAQPDAHAPGAR